MVITGQYGDLNIPKVDFFRFSTDIMKHYANAISMVRTKVL